jgi:hypothetical protein
MSQAEPRAETDIEKLFRLIEEQSERMDRQADAINNLGENLQWMIDMAKPLLEMLNSPMFGAMAPGLMSGAMSGLGKAAGVSGG